MGLPTFLYWSYSIETFPNFYKKKKTLRQRLSVKIGYFAINPSSEITILYQRKVDKYGKHKKENNYSEKHITNGMDQDPMNELVY